MSGRTRTVAHGGVIAAAYAALTLLVIQSPLGYGPVQLRLSEAVTVVACLTPAAVPGLWVGAVVANAYMLTQYGVLALFDVAPYVQLVAPSDAAARYASTASPSRS